MLDPPKPALSFVCAWDKCGKTYSGRMPKDWRALFVFWAPGAVTTTTDIQNAGHWDRDAVLCPTHVQALERRLKRI